MESLDESIIDFATYTKATQIRKRKEHGRRQGVHLCPTYVSLAM